MNKEQVIKLIGEHNWEDFCKFIKGQTVGIKDGVTNYYTGDVQRYMSSIGR